MLYTAIYISRKPGRPYAICPNGHHIIVESLLCTGAHARLKRQHQLMLATSYAVGLIPAPGLGLLPNNPALPHYQCSTPKKRSSIRITQYLCGQDYYGFQTLYSSDGLCTKLDCCHS